MKYLLIATMTAGLVVGLANPAMALGQGPGGGMQKGRGSQGKKSGPKDGTGTNRGKRQKGKRTGPQDGSGPIHTPPAQPKS